MTQITTFRSLAAASAFALVTGLAMMAQTGTASAKNVLSCEGGSKRSVVECCETIVQKKGLPLWMKQTGRNCNTVSVKCSKGQSTIAAVAVRECYIVAETRDEGKGPRPKDNGRDQRGGKDYNTKP